MTRCIPQNPDRDGHHWVRRFKTGPAIPIWWCAQWHENADRGWGKYTEADRENQWEYLGPCLSPDEIATERARADALAAALRTALEAWQQDDTEDPAGDLVTACFVALAAYDRDA